MKRLAQIFGFDKQKAWWYRDLALITVAAIMALWGTVAVLGTGSISDRWIGLGSAAIVLACWAITPNRTLLSVAVVAIVALQGWFAVLISGVKEAWWVALPATVLAAILIRKSGARPLVKK